MKIDWTKNGWRIYPDDGDSSRNPERCINADLRLKGPVTLHLDGKAHGWVIAREYEVVK